MPKPSGLAFVITRPTVFAFGAIVLLIGRPARDAIVLIAGGDRLEFDRKAARIHVLTIALLATALLVAHFARGETEIWI